MKLLNEKIKFRRATINDIGALTKLRIQFLDEIFPQNETTKKLVDNLTKYFSFSIPKGDCICRLAEYKNIIVATASMVVWHIPPKFDNETGKLGYILNMFTIPSFRKLGICSKLLEELFKEAKILEVKVVHLHASPDGINLYRKMGFELPEQPEFFKNI